MNDTEKTRHTTMSSNNLEIITFDNLSENEKNAVNLAKEKKKKSEEIAANRKVQGLEKDPFALGVKKGPNSALKRKRGREGDGEDNSSDEEVYEDTLDGDESR